MPSAFISYSWDSEEHKGWVRALATRLREDGVETTLDQWHVVPGDQLPAFMECAVRESDYVLIVCTPRYKKRSDNRAGGVGYEGDIITGEVLTTTRNERKFIPLLREGQWPSSAPSWLAGKYYVDLRGESYAEQRYNDLLTTVLGTRPKAPVVGRPQESNRRMTQVPTASEQAAGSAASFPDPIRITGIIVDEIGTPRNDGTRGSALYSVPFRLSRRPPHEWAQLFVQAWDHPPSFTSMHRPGIATVYGDKVVLDGTTVEEVEEDHRATLILAVQEANQQFQEFEARRRAEAERERERVDAHKKSAAGAAQRIKFD